MTLTTFLLLTVSSGLGLKNREMAGNVSTGEGLHEARAAMNLDELVETWKREEQEPFSGWDFSHLDGRMIEEQAPWSYSSRAAELMRQASSVIDLGTGGGERLLKLREYWPQKGGGTE